MKLVIFGLTISSSWGNGHATILRGLCRMLHQRGHSIVFFERDVPYYASHRDCSDPDFAELVLYGAWHSIIPYARRHLADADAAMVTSYCNDGPVALELMKENCRGLALFYDLDAPVTLSRITSGRPVPYIGPRALRDFDLVLSYTGGEALAGLQQVLQAPRVAPLYGSVDPQTHFPTAPFAHYRAALSYLGTYAEDRQNALEELFIGAARELPELRFIIGGSLYPADFPWMKNIHYVHHVPPANHGAFYCSSWFTLNVTRGAMAAMGYCPSGRLFEAAACGVPIISDLWKGLDFFYTPGSEIVTAENAAEVAAALQMPLSLRTGIARRARERTLDEHTAAHRAAEFERLLDSAQEPLSQTVTAPRDGDRQEAG